MEHIIMERILVAIFQVSIIGLVGAGLCEFMDKKFLKKNGKVI